MEQTNPLYKLLQKNREWAELIKKNQPGFFDRLAREQHPRFLWIGCSDSRVPAGQITQLGPGEMFVHRNIANLVLHSDINCQSVLQYAVEVLKVEHIIVCGHYGCGGIKAAMGDEKLGLIDNWLRNIREVYDLNRKEIGELESEKDRVNYLAELNVRKQVHNVCQNPFVQQEWADGRDLWVHGWIYDLDTGLLKNLEISSGLHEATQPA